MKLVDLTMPINEKTPTFPGDPKAEFKRIAICEKDGWNEHRISTNTHYGTHIDAPWHMIADGKRLTEFPIDIFIGDAIVIDVVGQQEIDFNVECIKEDDIVLLKTNHTKNAYEDSFFDTNPVISEELAKKLIDKKIRIIGIDSFTPDNEPFNLHKLFFKNDILILENIVNLDAITVDRFKINIFPIKYDKIDGAPCRVIAQLD